MTDPRLLGNHIGEIPIFHNVDDAAKDGIVFRKKTTHFPEGFGADAADRTVLEDEDWLCFRGIEHLCPVVGIPQSRDRLRFPLSGSLVAQQVFQSTDWCHWPLLFTPPVPYYIRDSWSLVGQVTSVLSHK